MLSSGKRAWKSRRFFRLKTTPYTSAAARPASLTPPTSRAFSPPCIRNFLVPIRIAPSSSAGAAGTEVTLEADPETITPEKAAAWLAAGINRISLGAQSFHDAELKPAGRMHRREDIFAAIAHLRAAGFANISLDLIAGLPYQTAASWQASVEEALRLRPEHISIYLFEVDEGSRLGRELLSGGSRYSAAAVPSDDAMAESYEFACERLREAGYDHYEISNWALPGFRSRHNLKYWRREPYLGFGAGAHSFDGRWRWANAHDPAAYAAAIEQGRLPVEQLEEVTPKQALEEELFPRPPATRRHRLCDHRGAIRRGVLSVPTLKRRLARALTNCALRVWSNAPARACALRPRAWPFPTKSSSPYWISRRAISRRRPRCSLLSFQARRRPLSLQIRESAGEESAFSGFYGCPMLRAPAQAELVLKARERWVRRWSPCWIS